MIKMVLNLDRSVVKAKPGDQDAFCFVLKNPQDSSSTSFVRFFSLDFINTHRLQTLISF